MPGKCMMHRWHDLPDFPMYQMCEKCREIMEFDPDKATWKRVNKRERRFLIGLHGYWAVPKGRAKIEGWDCEQDGHDWLYFRFELRLCRMCAQCERVEVRDPDDKEYQPAGAIQATWIQKWMWKAYEEKLAMREEELSVLEGRA